MLAKEDFNDDAKDAGDLGSGHTVTAIYELIPPGVEIPNAGKVDSLRYQIMPNTKATAKQAKYSDEVITVKLRYKEPDGDKSSLLSYQVGGNPVAIEKATDNFRFAAAVASFGMLLRNSEYKGAASYDLVKSMADKALGKDIEGYRKEFLQLVGIASGISSGKEIVKRDE
jgi:Ca-activated chloride channel family protein